MIIFPSSNLQVVWIIFPRRLEDLFALDLIFNISSNSLIKMEIRLSLKESIKFLFINLLKFWRKMEEKLMKNLLNFHRGNWKTLILDIFDFYLPSFLPIYICIANTSSKNNHPKNTFLPQSKKILPKIKKTLKNHLPQTSPTLPLNLNNTSLTILKSSRSLSTSGNNVNNILYITLFSLTRN